VSDQVSYPYKTTGQINQLTCNFTVLSNILHSAADKQLC
jgi:hypothetical protein